jgi:hypothetical protein
MTVLHDSAILALRGLLAATEGDIYTDAPECAASVEAVTVARNTATDVLAWADREAEQARVKALQDTARRLVNIEVLYNVSALVGDLRTLANECPHHLIRELSFDADDLTELCVRDPDADAYRDAAPQGLLVEADGDTWKWKEGEGMWSPPFDSELEAWRDAFDEMGEHQPDGDEIYEHWIVSDWLADKLKAKGETVARDICGLTIWGRATTGQAIYIDGVIEAIARDLVEG